MKKILSRIEHIIVGFMGFIVLGIIIIAALLILSLLPGQLGDSFFDMYRPIL